MNKHKWTARYTSIPRAIPPPPCTPKDSVISARIKPIFIGILRFAAASMTSVTHAKIGYIFRCVWWRHFSWYWRRYCSWLPLRKEKSREMELLKERFEWFAAFCYSQWRCRPNDLIVEAKKKLLSMVRYHELLRHEDHVCGISNREKCVPADYRRHSPTWNSSRNSFFFPFSSTPLHPCSNFFRHFRRQCQRDRELEILRSEDTRRESLDDWL